MISLRRPFPMLAAMAALLVAGTAHAQPTGRLSGTARDAPGAALPGAAVAIANAATGATQTVTSGTDGTYSATLAPGVYTVTASLRGFGRQTKREVKVEAAAAAVD